MNERISRRITDIKVEHSLSLTDQLLTVPSDRHINEEWQRGEQVNAEKVEGLEPEKTIILNGTDEIQSSAIDAASRARRYIDSCMDKAGPSSLLKTEPLWKVIMEMRDSGIKFRFVTEITADTINYCKELAKIVELRHTDNVSGNFAIYDGTRYRASASSVEGSPDVLVESTARPIVEQQQYFFDMLWNKAIPADQRIRHLELGVTPEITEVLTGWENIFKRNIDDLSQAWQKIDSCCDAGVPTIIVGSPMYEASHDFVDRGGKIRMITEIGPENLGAIRELMKFQEIRHIGNFKINFGLSEKSFMAPTSVYATSSNPQCIYSNSKDLIREHQYLFDTLWEKALPVDQRIRQIESGIEPEKIELIQETRNSIALAFEIMKRTSKELLILFASPRTFMLGYGLGSLETYDQMSKRGVSVRLLVPNGIEIENEVAKIRDLYPSIDVRVSDSDLNTNITIMVSDRKAFINWQLKDDTLSDPYEAGGIATYATIHSLASSYATIFDNLWKITEIAESLKAANTKLKNSETSMKEFIDIAAHELRTPVQPIIGLAEVLQGKTKDHEWLDLIDAILRNANRLKRLQQNILDVSKIENQLVRYEREIFGIDELIVQLVREDEQNSSDSERPKILMDLHSNSQVDGDRQRIAQVILNLLGNAMEFTKASIEISSRVQNGEVVVDVNDTGTGIDPEIMPKLFSKFSTRSTTGTGLGLFISKSIVEAHGGRIWAKNKERGKGAVFSFSLPIISS